MFGGGANFSGVTFTDNPVVVPVLGAKEGAALDAVDKKVTLGNDVLLLNGDAALTKDRQIGTDGFSLFLQDFLQLPGIVFNQLFAGGYLISNDIFGSTLTADSNGIVADSFGNTAQLLYNQFTITRPAGDTGSVTPLAVACRNGAGDTVSVRSDRVEFIPASGINAFSLRINAGVLEFVHTTGNVVLATVNLQAGNGAAEFRTLTQRDTVLLHSLVALANGAGGSVGTLTNAPAAGNPTKWITIDDNGTPRQIPAW
jgi:hypothetical protein